MARPSVAGCVIGDALIGQSISVVINPRALGAIADHNIVASGQLCQSLRHPIFRRQTINGHPIHRRASAPMRGLLDQQNPNSGCSRRTRRLQPGNSAAHHHHLAMMIVMLIAVLITRFRRFAQTCGMTNDRLINMFPKGARVNEHLVIKASRQETRQLRIDCTHVKFQRGKMIL